MTLNEQKGSLIEPYGGQLVNLLVTEEELIEERSRAAELPRVQLTPRNVCDLELLATGAFSPLTSFMGRSDYEQVLNEMRLASGLLFPLPITFTVKRDAGIKVDRKVTLVDQYNNVLAMMRVDEIF